MTELLNSGFVDSFRFLYPEKENAYTWWSYMMKAREKNIGWRIDYFITSKSIRDIIEDAKIHDEIMGSDHCPIELDLRNEKWRRFGFLKNEKVRNWNCP